MKPLNAIDLFAGPGGWDLAAKALGFDPLGIELDDAACATREAAGLRTLQGDVAALDPLDVGYDEGGAYDRACIDLLIASPPCQAWSTAGKQAGKRDQGIVFACLGDLAAGNDTRAERLAECEDDRSLLVVEPLRWALALKPRFIALEQVPPVLEVWSMIAQILATRGYSTWAGKLSAEQFGVPQTRERAILMADREQRVEPPAPTHAKYVKPKKEREWEGLFEAPREVERIVRSEDRELLPWVSMAEALGWCEGDAVGFPRADDTGSGGYRERDRRPASEPAFTVGEKVRSATRLRSGSTERAAGEPSPAVHFGHRANKVEWVMEKTEDRPERKAQGAGNSPRSVDEPAATIDSRSDLSKWVYDRPAPTIVTTRRSKDGILVGRQHPPGEGENVGGRNWKPPALAACGCDMGVVDAGGFCACCHAHLDDPDGFYAIQGDGTHSHRDCPANWPAGRPATTVAGDPRISKPGRHDPEESGSQQKDAIRVSLGEALELQSFPGDYPVQGTNSQRYLQVGNAIPPLLALAILTQLLHAEVSVQAKREEPPMSEKRWTIEKWGSNPQAGSVKGPETEKVDVIPADAKNVLTVEEARQLVRAAWNEDTDTEVVDRVLSRLDTYVEENSDV